MSNVGTNTLVEIKNLEKVYPDGHRALENISFSLGRAEFVVVIGKSGAGKSTLLRCINGLTEPTSGEVLIGGYDLAGASGNELRIARKEIGFIFQQFNLVKRLSALDNVLCGKLAGMPLLKSCLRRFTKEDKLVALEYLDRVGLADKALQRADTLSGGQQQRVAIARTLAQNPQVVLADEPVASLDPESSRIVMDNLRSLADDEGIAVICNLHQVELAERYADRILGVREGRVVLDGRPEEVGAAEIEHVYGVPAKEVA